MVEQRLGVFEEELHEPLAHAFLPLAQQRMASDEGRRLVELDSEAEAGLQRRVRIGDVVAVVAVGLLDPERVHGVHAGMAEPHILPGVDQRVVDARRELGRDVELPAKLAHVGNARRAGVGVAKLDLPAAAEGKGLVGEVVGAQRLQQVPRKGAHDAEHGEARGHIGEHRVRALGDVALEPEGIPHLELAGGHDQIVVVCEPCDGEIGLDAARIVEPLRVDDAAGRHVHLVGGNPAQHPRGVPALEAELGEGGLVEQAHPVTHRAVLFRRTGEPVLAAEAVFVAGLRAVRRVPVRPLPAEGLAVTGTARREAIVERRAAHPPRGRVLAEGPVHVVEEAEGLAHPLAQIAPVGLEGQVAAYVHVPHVDERPAGVDAFGQHLPGAAGRLDADGVEPGGDVAAGETGRLAEMVAVVRREALGPAEEGLDTGVGERRHPLQRVHQHRLEVLVVVGQLVEAEILGDSVHAPGLRLRLEGAEQDLARVLLVIGAAVVVAQHGQVRRHTLEGVRHHVEVLAGVERHVDADRGRELARPHAG